MKDFFLDSSVEQNARDLIFKFDADFGENESHYHLNYERGVYREKELADLIWSSIPTFALTPEEYENYIGARQHANLQKVGLQRISKAKANSKGDYGELLLFLILEIFENTPKFVTKVKLRSSRLDQIKGYDCAHFSVDSSDKVSLWLGEAKFHKSLSSGVSDAIKSLSDHFSDDFIKDEIAILNSNYVRNSQISERYYKLLEANLRGSKSLDDIDIVVPILLTYDSSAIKKMSDTGKEFRDALITEFEKYSKLYVNGKKWPKHRIISLRFYFMPFHSVGNVKRLLEAKENAHI